MYEQPNHISKRGLYILVSGICVVLSIFSVLAVQSLDPAYRLGFTIAFGLIGCGVFIVFVYHIYRKCTDFDIEDIPPRLRDDMGLDVRLEV